MALEKPSMTISVCLVMCSNHKLSTGGVAHRFYLSERFIADKLIATTFYADWRIISGKYGVLAPDARVEPYEIDLDHEAERARDRWIERISDQLVDWLGECGAKYVGLRARGFYLEGTSQALANVGYFAESGREVDPYGSVMRVRE